MAEKKNEMATTNTTTALKKETENQKKEYNKLVGSLMREYSKVESSSLKMAFMLYEIYNRKLFEFDEYKNIYEFGDDRFNLGRGTVNNFINIVEKFGKRTPEGEIILGADAGLIDDFEKFTFSKLCLIVSVPSEYWSEFYSAMTVKQIREKKAEIAKLIEADNGNSLLEASDDVDMDGAMNEPETDDDSTVDDSTSEPEVLTDAGKHCFLHILSCSTLGEMADKLTDKNIVAMLCAQLDKFTESLPEGTIANVSIGLTFDR